MAQYHYNDIYINRNLYYYDDIKHFLKGEHVLEISGQQLNFREEISDKQRAVYELLIDVYGFEAYENDIVHRDEVYISCDIDGNIIVNYTRKYLWDYLGFRTTFLTSDYLELISFLDTQYPYFKRTIEQKVVIEDHEVHEDRDDLHDIDLELEESLDDKLM